MQPTMIDDAQDAKQFLPARRNWENHRVTSVKLWAWLKDADLKSRCLSTMDKKSGPGKATDCAAQIVITVTPDTREPLPSLCRERSGTPVHVTSRFLMAHVSCSREDTTRRQRMRWDVAEDWALRGPLGAATTATTESQGL
jgi:hypothetical protein